MAAAGSAYGGSDVISQYIKEIKGIGKIISDIPMRERAKMLFGYTESEPDFSEFSVLFQRFQREMGLSKNIIEAYDNWVDNGFLEKCRAIKLTGGNRLQDFTVQQTEITPHDCASSSESYLLTIKANRVSPKGLVTNVTVGEIPLMKGSKYCFISRKSDEHNFSKKECFNDPQGYFFIKGGERVILCRENLARLQFICRNESKDRKTTTECSFTCWGPDGPSTITIVGNDDGFFIRHKKTGPLTPLGNVMIYLGILRDRDENARGFSLDDNIKVDVADPAGIISYVTDSLNYIRNPGIIRMYVDSIATSVQIPPITKRKYVDQQYGNIFPHLTSNRDKLILLYKMTLHMLKAMTKRIPFDNRDSWSNKRVETAGRALENYFAPSWTSIYASLSTMPENLTNLGIGKGKNGSFINAFDLSSRKVVGGISNDFSSDNMKRESRSVDILRRETPMAIFSQLRQIVSYASPRMKSPYIRQIHPSQLGYVCVAETPEGTNCGLLKYLASTCWISIDRYNIKDTVIQMIQHLKTPEASDDAVCVMYNSEFLGFYTDEAKTMRALWNLKSNRNTFDVSIRCLDGDIYVFADGSRVTCPMLTLDENKSIVYDPAKHSSMSILDLVENGIIEFISALEIENMYQGDSGGHDGPVPYEPYECVPEEVENQPEEVRRTKTHCFMVGHASLGISSSCIPYANHNQGPRITYQASMAKQACSTYHTHYASRNDTSFKRLISPCRPIVETDMYEPVGLRYQPAGDNVIVAIFADPNNNEDAITVNQRFLDNHLLIEKHFVTKVSLGNDEIVIPPNAKDNSDPKYHAVLGTGLPKIGSFINVDDVILSISRSGTSSAVRASIGEDGFVVGVFHRRSTDENIIVVRMKQIRRQKCGDKVASRFSQKGTFGSIRHPSTMPRVKGGPNDGLIPDFLFNPHSIPSRMTQGKIIEMLMSKAAMYEGTRVDGTSFKKPNREWAHATLASAGLDINGEEQLWGRQGTAFIAPCFYQCLRHHVYDKIQFRDIGGVDKINRQPLKGKSNCGGLRFGEMERDAAISHGASGLVLDRLMNSSDKHSVEFCTFCNTILAKRSDNKKACGVCMKEGTIVRVNVPWVMLSIIRALKSIAIETKFTIE